MPATAPIVDVNRRTKSERGYVLLTLMLTVSLMVFAAAVVAPSIAFQIKRDREEELVHRASQYRRAVRLYAKAGGHFPLVIDELYDRGGVKYLRKLYKDPITKRDFRLLHTADTTPITQRPADPNGSDASSGNQNGADSDSNTANSQTAQLDPSANQGLIFGVASTSKRKTIREFDHKNHYNEWLFFYDLNHDRGYEMKGPTPLNMPAAVGRPVGQPAGGQPEMGQPQQQPDATVPPQ